MQMSTRNSKKPVKNNGHDLKDLLAVRECLNLLEQHKLAEAKKSARKSSSAHRGWSLPIMRWA